MSTVDELRTGSKLSHFLWYWAPPLGYCLIIFVLSSLSRPVSIPSFYGGDKVVHIIEYAVLAVLLARGILLAERRSSKRAGIFLTVVLVTLYGISDEIHQAFVPNRYASLWDVLADGVGGAVGALFYTHLLVRKTQREGEGT